MKSSCTTPKAYVEACNILHVQQVVRDQKTYPSPLRAVGNVLSPSDIHQNTDGSIIAMHRLTKIYGIVELCGQGQDKIECLKAQAGATFADVNEWLHKQKMEMSFCAEIGSATLGGTCFTTTKESSVGPVTPSGGLGDFASCVMGIDLVDTNGELQQHRLFDENGEMDSSFQVLLSSEGTQGIAVVVYIAARECIPVTTQVNFLPFTNNGTENVQLAKRLQAMYEKRHENDGNIFAIISCVAGYACVEERAVCTKKTCCRSPLGFIVKPIYVPIKKMCFQTCSNPSIFKFAYPLNGSWFLRYHEAHRRPGFRYPDVPVEKRRLTFSYASFDYISFTTTVENGMAFIQRYKKQSGFSPDGMAIYFVTRSGFRAAGPYAGKGQGTSFSFDPIFHDPLDKGWLKFCEAFTVWADENGGRPSLNQTPQIQTVPKFGSLCVAGIPEPRFTSKWMQQFFDAKADTDCHTEATAEAF